MEIGRDMWPEWDLKLMTPEQLAQSYVLETSGDANKDDVSRANDWRSSVMQYQAAYNRMTPEERANWDRAYAPRIAEYERMKGRVSQEELTRWKYQQYMKDYCAVIKGVDENVGRLLDYLEEIGELDNTIIVYTSDQGVYDTRKEIAIMLGWEQRRVVVENKYVGGGFGGKEDVSAQHVAVLCALKVGRPVKFRFSRQESINFHPKRHYMEATFTLGCDEDGIFTGLDCEIYFDTGAYASLSGPVLERACTHSVGPYCYQNTDIRGYSYYTNNPPAGAFRGFGVTQSEFALESIINLLAEKVGISPWEIRYRNAIEPGKVLPNGQIADVSTALKECLLAVKPAYDANPGRVGIACAMKNSGVGVGLPDKGRCRLEVHDGVVQLYSAASDIGQGCATIFLQELAQTTGLPLSQMKNMGSNSELSPDSGTTSGSRQTLITGEAVRMAAVDLKKDLDEAGGDLSKLEGKEYFAEFFDPTDKLGADVPFPKSHVAYGFAAHVVVLDDEGKVKEVYAAHDSGRVVNPTSIQGQIEGGVLMGMGYALTETFPLEDCVPTARYGTLGLLHSTQIPDIHAIYVEKDELLPFAYGSKGIGEISAIPTAPAVQGAYYFRDGKFRTSLPLEDTYYSKKH